jgi:sugar phosphate isomerase/epimerase
MRLGLSSAAAPDLALGDLLEGCRRRGLATLELVLGDAHGVEPGASEGWIREVRRRMGDAGVSLAALVCPAGETERARAAIPLAARLDAPLLLTPGPDLEELEGLAGEAAAAGVTLLLSLGTDAGEAERLRGFVSRLPAGRAALAWEVDPATDDPAAGPAVLRALGPYLAHVRFRGGGPESVSQTGQGVGAFMARLALARYSGPLVLLPTDPRHHYVWCAWLGRAGGWGCGSKQSDDSLFTLPHPAGA